MWQLAAARNIARIKDLIGASTVEAIHDPYTQHGSLWTILRLADIGTKFSSTLRILGYPYNNATEKAFLIKFLKDINTQRKSRWEIRTYTEP